MSTDHLPAVYGFAAACLSGLCGVPFGSHFGRGWGWTFVALVCAGTFVAFRVHKLRTSRSLAAQAILRADGHVATAAAWLYERDEPLAAQIVIREGAAMWERVVIEHQDIQRLEGRS